MARYPLSLRLQVPVDFTGEEVVVGAKCFPRSVKWRQNLVAAVQQFNKLECGPPITIEDGLVYRQGTVIATFSGSTCSTELDPEGVKFLDWLALRHPGLVETNALKNSPAAFPESIGEPEQSTVSPPKLTAEGMSDEPSLDEEAPESLNPGSMSAGELPPLRDIPEAATVSGREADFGGIDTEPAVSTLGAVGGLGHDDAHEHGSNEGCKPSAAVMPATSELTSCDPGPPLPEVGVDQPTFSLEAPEAGSTDVELAEFFVESSEHGYIVELAGRVICCVKEESNLSVAEWLDGSFEQSESDGTAMLVARLIA